MARINNPIIVVGGGATVQLYAPTISLSGLTLTITNSANNGAFVEGYDIYSGSTKIGTTTSTTYDLATSSGMTSGSNSITVKATAQGFIDSASSNAETVSIYTVTNTLSNITTSNSASIVLASGSYSATLTPATGWTYGTTTVTMGGNDITSTAYDNGVITIASVTGNIVVTATAYVSITNTLTGVTNSNGATAVAYGSSYTGTITVSSGYTMEGATISITMGGVDITSTAYSNGTITIASVTGVVAITISAVATAMPYIKFQSNDNTQFALQIANNVKRWNGTIQTSSDGGSTWTNFVPTSSPNKATSSATGELLVRGSNNTYITDSTTTSTSGCWAFVDLINSNTRISCTGNIENLLDYTTVSNGGHPVMDNYAFSYMFYGCTTLISPPSLPATILSQRCYQAMFRGCTSLASVPALPATTLPAYCYAGMFRGCTQLSSLPELPATEIFGSACTSMFNSCGHIKLSATQTGEYQNPYRIPPTGTATLKSGSNHLVDMFTSTGGTFVGTPNINTTYYTSNTVIS